MTIHICVHTQFISQLIVLGSGYRNKRTVLEAAFCRQSHSSMAMTPVLGSSPTLGQAWPSQSFKSIQFPIDFAMMTLTGSWWFETCRFPRKGVPQNRWFVMENPTKMNEETSISWEFQHPN